MTTTHRLIHAVAAFGLLIMVSDVTWAAKPTYKCKTSTGAIIYTATPALGQQCSKMTMSGVAPATAAIAPKTTTARHASSAPAATLSADKATPTRATAAECESARKNQDTLQTGQRIYETNAQGERSYLDDTQRTERIKQNQQIISTRCPS
jgi:hypothetical protein